MLFVASTNLSPIPHELRTPLSVIQAEATLALGKERERERIQGSFGDHFSRSFLYVINN